MKKILGFKAAANLALFVMLISGLVFTIGFGACLWLARQEVTEETNKKVQRDIDYVRAFIDGQMQRIEDAAFSLASRNFGHTIRKEDGTSSVDIDLKTFVRPTPEECFTLVTLCRMPHHRSSCKSAAEAVGQTMTARQFNAHINHIGRKMGALKNTIRKGSDGAKGYEFYLMKDHSMEKGFLVTTLREEIVEAVQDYLLNLLIERFKEIHAQKPFNGNEEAYKWELISECKDKNPLEIVTTLFRSPYNNLVYSLNQSTLGELINNIPNKLTKVISQLFDDAQPLTTRLEAFGEAMRNITPKNKSVPNDERTAAALLSCHNGQRYTFYLADGLYAPLCHYLGETKKTKK